LVCELDGDLAAARVAEQLLEFEQVVMGRLGLSNGRLEGLNSRVWLISHRSFGFHGATPLIALVYLCCGGVTITPPLR
jgi:hypothetical protein